MLKVDGISISTSRWVFMNSIKDKTDNEIIERVRGNARKSGGSHSLVRWELDPFHLILFRSERKLRGMNRY